MTAPHAIEAIDVHGHYGEYSNAAHPLANKFRSGDLGTVTARAAQARTAITVVSPIAALTPRGNNDPVGANENAARHVREYSTLRFWVVIDPQREQTFTQAKTMLRQKECVGIKIHPEEHLILRNPPTLGFQPGHQSGLVKEAWTKLSIVIKEAAIRVLDGTKEIIAATFENVPLISRTEYSDGGFDVCIEHPIKHLTYLCASRFFKRIPGRSCCPTFPLIVKSSGSSSDSILRTPHSTILIGRSSLSMFQRNCMRKLA